MKTTVDLPNQLLDDVRLAAERRGWTVRVLFEESLRSFLEGEAAEGPKAPFKLQHTIVKGNGLVNPGQSFAGMLAMSGIDRQGDSQTAAKSATQSK